MMTQRIVLYLLVLAVPLGVAAAVGEAEDDPISVVTALRFGLLGLTIVSLQFVLASRSKWIEFRIGLDKIFRFHRAMAICAAFLLLLHPVLLAQGKQYWGLLTSFSQSPPVLIGKIALALIVMLAITGVYRLALRLEFQRWRTAHNIFGVLTLVLGTAHALYLGHSRDFPVFKTVPLILLAVGLCAYLYAKVIAPARAARSPYVILDVIPETSNVTTLRLAPTRRPIDPHVPGQFAFIRVLSGSAVPSEEHPFTISSPPTQSGELTFTIKAVGDFTDRVRDAKQGDLVAVQGPFGVFSNAFHPDEKELVLIAGGIGITPLMSMIRGLRASGTGVSVLLLYGNETESDIVFRQELDDIARSGDLDLRVVYVLNKPDDEWHGGRGYITRELISRECGENLAGKAFYVCGPAPMMDYVRHSLRELGVPGKQIHWERFAL